ncbi:S-adenosyl-L-methionine-dependent methyltransferase [Pyronema omphalodes]|nr:S-adenosyl-L-methionine-dependent methyltransferase [Pyronema omphalodes]
MADSEASPQHFDEGIAGEVSATDGQNILGQIIEVDPAVLENTDEEAYGSASSGAGSSTQSLTESIQEYVFENGRRYHAYYGKDKNLLPTDEIEQDRMDMHHEIMLLLLDNELHRAPLSTPHRILDVGTGTGIWAIDMADKYPMAEVIGMDLSPIQPLWVPPNCKFEVDDAEKEWTYHSNYFDFIHVRNVSQGITNWSKMMDEIYRCTTPGGHVELAEVGTIAQSDDNTMADDNPIKIYFDMITKCFTSIGRPPATVERMKASLEEAGFVDVCTETVKQPLGPWPKKRRLKNLGLMTLMNFETAFHAYGMAAFTRILGMTEADADKVCSDALSAARNKNYHTYGHYYIVWGRKPEGGGDN